MLGSLGDVGDVFRDVDPGAVPKQLQQRYRPCIQVGTSPQTSPREGELDPGELPRADSVGDLSSWDSPK
jgi:hypothetical protein